MLTAILVGVFQIALFVLAGVLAGFGESPYAHRPHVIALNVLYVGTRLGGQEMARWYLVFSLGRRGTFLGLTIAWALLWVVTVPLSQFGNLTSLEAGFPTLGRTLLPSASEGMLATYLVLLGGPLASIAYRGTLAAFEWLSPILPNLRWTLYAFLGVLAPTLGLLIVRDLAKWRASDIEERQGAREVPKRSTGTAWVLLATFAVSLFWFNTGLFGVRPDLITGVSMEPTMKAGDIAISRDVSPREVDVGDVVRFRQDEVYVLHRVVEVNRERGRYVFTTKGDNSTLDDAVDESQLEGRVVACVPKVGWPMLFVKKLLFRLVR